MTYDLPFKIEVLDWHEANGQVVTRTAEHFDITRQSLYRWLDQQEPLREQLIEDQAQREVTEKRRQKTLEKAEQQISKVLDGEQAEGIFTSLEKLGGKQRRKELLGAKVEKLLWAVVSTFEDGMDLLEMHPKDRGQLAERLHAIKQDLYDEPKIIIEVRNQFIQDALHVIKEMGLDRGQALAFAEKMKAIEQAQFQEV